MKRFLLSLLLVLATLVRAATPEPLQELRPLMQQPKAAHLTAELLGRFHYKAVPLDDALSEKIFERFLKSLDSEKLLFLEADVERFSPARTRLDDAILDEDLAIPFEIFNFYTKRMAERFDYSRGLLKSGFDFTANESFRYVREKEARAKSMEELRNLWRQRVKNDWLSLKIAGKDDKKIVETLDKRYENSLKRIGKLKSEDAFQIFMNAYTMAVEPHTNYMGPQESADFDIAMKLSLVGIGAVLEEKDEYTTIKELVAGGPAILSGKLKVGDRIVGVGQGGDSPVTDVVGWRLDETVGLIRGKLDTQVVLDILPVNVGPEGKHKSISLVRKKISLETQAAKKSILDIDENGVKRRIGVISLPTFYQDFEARRKGDKNFRSATRDVERLLTDLKKENVDGVLIDLRNNGGGSLVEAIELTGLFIDKGPVVQQRDAKGKLSVSWDLNAGTAWDGPLGVLINRASASASEIFAAAIQDYHRGLIIGEGSYGKGTVQTMFDLDEITRQPKVGELKLTIAQFFRINGGTTQLNGVTPDISLPATSDPQRYGESSYENALPAMHVKPAVYTTLGDLQEVLPLLQFRHDKRVVGEKDFQYLLEDIAEFDQQRKKNLISLNEKERKKEHDTREARVKAREPAEGKSAADKPAEKTAEKSAESEPAAEHEPGLDKPAKDAKDPLLKEAAHILGDEVDLMLSRPDLAARLMPKQPSVR